MKRFLLTSVVTAALSVLIYLSFPARLIDMKAYDIYSCLRGAVPHGDAVILVGIDPASFAHLEQPWPWPRSLHGRLIEALRERGVRLIVMDILFSEPSVPAEDESLAQAIRKWGQVVLAADVEIVRTAKYTQNVLSKPLPALLDAGARYGISSIPVDADNVVRRIFWGAGAQPSLELAAMAGLGLKAGTAGQRLVSFPAEGPGLTCVPYYQALDPDAFFPSDFFRGKTVIVGKHPGPPEGSARPQGKYGLNLQPPNPVRGVDMFATPAYVLESQLMPGLEIHGHMLATLIDDVRLAPLRTPHAVGMLVAMAVLLALVNRAWSPARSIGINLGALAGSVVCSFLLFERRGVFLPFAAPLACIFTSFTCSGIMSYVGVERKRRFLNKAFALFVSPQVARKVLQDPDRLNLGGQRVLATVLFSDLAGFTRMSEGREPEDVVAVLNRYMTAMGRVILRHDGMLDKFIGDAIMAMWGTPAADEEQAARACRAALEMQRRLKALAGEVDLGGFRLAMRIGINTGIVMAGNMGSEERFTFTVIGDHVNVAAHLQTLNKVYGTEIIVSQATVARLGGRFAVRELDTVRLKKKTDALRVYELLDGEGFACAGRYGEGLQLYRTGAFQEARRRFEDVLTAAPHDPPSRVMRDRCAHLAANPPAAGWDGVWAQ